MTVVRNFSVLLLLNLLLICSPRFCNAQNSSQPILLLATNANFGTYTGEILKAEGFNEFQIDSLSDSKVSLTYLKQFNIVIVAETLVSNSNKKLLTEYVKSGGNLIAFRPDKKLRGLFGISETKDTIDQGYIAFDVKQEECNGISSKKMQFHGTADKYSLNGAKTIATLFGSKTDIQGFPGVVSNSFGKGNALAFLYNLPKSIIYTRQGNPLFAGIEKDNIPGLRGIDLFTDRWVDTSLNTINQADQQMALLSNCIQQMTLNSKPLPRFWYFPDTLDCLITLTNDGEFQSETNFEPQFQDVDSMGAKMSLYLLQPEKVSKEWAKKWTDKGFEIAGHPDDTKEAGHPIWQNMDNMITLRKNEIANKYGLTMRTNANHWFVWCGNDANGKQDFGAEAKLEEKHGIGMDINYIHYDINSNQGANYLGPLGTNQGNFTGSGLTMKYADGFGKTINVYQHFNAVYDQQYKESHDPDGFYNCFKGLVDRSINDDIFSIVSVKSHNDEYYFSKVPLMKMLTYANTKGIPVWTVEKLLDFLKMKDEASFTNLIWSKNQLSFNLNSSLKHSNGLTFMVPAMSGGLNIKTIAIDDVQAPFIVKSEKGNKSAFVTIKGGQKYSVKVVYRN